MWDEVTFLKPSDTDVERMNRTYVFEKSKLKKKLLIMRDKLSNMYGFGYPKKRRVMEERLSFLESEFQMFDYKINPYHVQPGLLLDVDITSIKKKKATLDGMANVLNEFLHGVSKGFQDAAFASFSRRRSTVRDDIAQSFAGGPPEGKEGGGTEGGSEYLSMIGSTDTQTVTTKTTKSKRSGGKKKGGDSLKEI
jgi:hypothetical protein